MKTKRLKRRYRPREPEPPEFYQCPECSTVFTTLAAFDAHRGIAPDDVDEPLIIEPEPIIVPKTPASRPKVFASGALDLTRLKR